MENPFTGGKEWAKFRQYGFAHLCSFVSSITITVLLPDLRTSLVRLRNLHQTSNAMCSFTHHFGKSQIAQFSSFHLQHLAKEFEVNVSSAHGTSHWGDSVLLQFWNLFQQPRE